MSLNKEINFSALNLQQEFEQEKDNESLNSEFKGNKLLTSSKDE